MATASAVYRAQVYKQPVCVNKECIQQGSHTSWKVLDFFLKFSGTNSFLQLVMYVLQWIVLSNCIYRVSNCCLSVI